MAVYATISDLERGAITPAAGARFGDASKATAIEWASAIADSYIVSQFDLPLIAYDASLTVAVCVIAAYYLYTMHGYSPVPGSQDALIRERYDNAIRWLELVRDEKIHPPWTDSGSDPTTGGGAYAESDPVVGFTVRALDLPLEQRDPWGGS